MSNNKQQQQSGAQGNSNNNNNNRKLVSWSFSGNKWNYLSSVNDDVASIMKSNSAKNASSSSNSSGSNPSLVPRDGWGLQELRSYSSSSTPSGNNNNSYKILALFEGNFDDQGRRNGWGTLRVFRPNNNNNSITTCISIACRWVTDVPQIEWDPCRLVEELLRSPNQINNIPVPTSNNHSNHNNNGSGGERPACDIYNDSGRRLISVYNGLMLAISQDFTSDRFAYGLHWALSTQFLPHTLGEKHDVLTTGNSGSGSYVPAPQGGTKYCGQWQMGERHGFGMERQISTGGLVYAGPYDCGLRHGVGLLFHHQSKTCLDATWHRGRIADCPGALHIQGYPINVLGRWSGDSTVSQGRLCRSNGASGLWEMLFAEFDEQMATLQEEVEIMMTAKSNNNSPASSPSLHQYNNHFASINASSQNFSSGGGAAAPSSSVLFALPAPLSASPHNKLITPRQEHQLLFLNDLKLRILHAKDEISSVCEPIGCVLATPQLRSLLAVFQRCFLFSYGSCSPSGDDIGGGMMTAMDMASATPPCLAEDEENDVYDGSGDDDENENEEGDDANAKAVSDAAEALRLKELRQTEKLEENQEGAEEAEATDEVFLAPKTCMSWCGLAVRDMNQRNIFPPEFVGRSQQSHLLCIHRQRNAARDSDVELFTRAVEDVVALVISVRLRLMNLANSTIIGNGGQGLLSPSNTFSAEAIMQGVSAPGSLPQNERSSYVDFGSVSTTDFISSEEKARREHEAKYLLVHENLSAKTTCVMDEAHSHVGEIEHNVGENEHEMLEAQQNNNNNHNSGKKLVQQQQQQQLPPLPPPPPPFAGLLNNHLLRDHFYDFISTSSYSATDGGNNNNDNNNYFNFSSRITNKSVLFNSAFTDSAMQSLTYAGTPLTPSARAAVCSWDAVLDVALPPLLKHAANVCKLDNAKFVLAAKRLTIHTNYPSSLIINNNNNAASQKEQDSSTPHVVDPSKVLLERKALELLSVLLPSEIIKDASSCEHNKNKNNEEGENIPSSGASSTSHQQHQQQEENENIVSSSSSKLELAKSLQVAIAKYSSQLVDAAKLFANIFTAPASAITSSGAAEDTHHHHVQHPHQSASLLSLSETSVSCASESTQSGLLFGCFRHHHHQVNNSSMASSNNNFGKDNNSHPDSKRIRSNKAQRLKKVGHEGAISLLVSTVATCGIKVREASSEFSETICNAYLKYKEQELKNYFENGNDNGSSSSSPSSFSSIRESVHNLISSVAHPRRITYECGFRFVVCFAASLTSTPKSMLPQLVLLDTICEAEAPERAFDKMVSSKSNNNNNCNNTQNSSPIHAASSISTHSNEFRQATDEMFCALLGIWRSTLPTQSTSSDDDDDDTTTTSPVEGGKKNSSSNNNNKNSIQQHLQEILAHAAVPLATGAVFPITLLAQWSLRCLRGAILEVASLSNTPSPIVNSTSCSPSSSTTPKKMLKRPCCCFCSVDPERTFCFCACTYAPSLFSCDIKGKVEVVLRDFTKPMDTDPTTLMSNSSSVVSGCGGGGTTDDQQQQAVFFSSHLAINKAAWFSEYRRTFRRPLQFFAAGSQEQQQQAENGDTSIFLQTTLGSGATGGSGGGAGFSSSSSGGSGGGANDGGLLGGLSQLTLNNFTTVSASSSIASISQYAISLALSGNYSSSSPSSSFDASSGGGRNSRGSSPTNSHGGASSSSGGGHRREMITDVPFSTVVDKALTLLKAASKNVVVSTSLLNQIQHQQQQQQQAANGDSPPATLASARGPASASVMMLQVAVNGATSANPNAGAIGGGVGAIHQLSSSAGASSQSVCVPVHGDMHEAELLRRIGRLATVLRELSVKTEVLIRKDGVEISDSDDDDDDENGVDGDNNFNGFEDEDNDDEYAAEGAEDGLNPNSARKQNNASFRKTATFANANDNNNNNNKQTSNIKNDQDDDDDFSFVSQKQQKPQNTTTNENNTDMNALLGNPFATSTARFAVSSSDDEDDAENKDKQKIHVKKDTAKSISAATIITPPKQSEEKSDTVAETGEIAAPKNKFLDTSSSDDDDGNNSDDDDPMKSNTMKRKKSNIVKHPSSNNKSGSFSNNNNNNKEIIESENSQRPDQSQQQPSSSASPNPHPQHQDETTTTTTNTKKSATIIVTSPTTSSGNNNNGNGNVTSSRSVVSFAVGAAAPSVSGARTTMTSASSGTAASLKRRGLSTIQPAAGAVPEKKICVKFSSATHIDLDKLSDFVSASSGNDNNNNNHKLSLYEKKISKIQKLKRYLHQQQVIDEDAAESILEFWVGKRHMFQRPVLAAANTNTNVSKRR